MKYFTSQACPVGPEANILEPTSEQCARMWLKQPILSRKDVKILRATTYRGWRTKVLDMSYPAADGVDGLVPALDRICKVSRHCLQHELVTHSQLDLLFSTLSGDANHSRSSLILPVSASC